MKLISSDSVKRGLDVLVTDGDHFDCTCGIWPWLTICYISEMDPIHPYVPSNVMWVRHWAMVQMVQDKFAARIRPEYWEKIAEF